MQKFISHQKDFNLKFIILRVVILLILSLSILIVPNLVLAQVSGGGFVPCGNTVGEPCNVSHLFKTVEVIINYLIAVAV